SATIVQGEIRGNLKRPFSTIVEQRDSQSLQNPPLKSLALPFRRTAWHATKTLFGDCADLAAYLTARRDLRVHVRVRSPGTDGSDDRGKITSLELLRRLRPGDDVGRRDHSRHGALLRALRSKTRAPLGDHEKKAPKDRHSPRSGKKKNPLCGFRLVRFSHDGFIWRVESEENPFPSMTGGGSALLSRRQTVIWTPMAAFRLCRSQ